MLYKGQFEHLTNKFNTKIIFSKAMPASFGVTLFNGYRDNDESNHLPLFVSITVTTATEKIFEILYC